MHRKLVVVADGARAQLLSAKGRKLQEVLESYENLDLNSHESKRLKDSGLSGGHHYEQHSNPRTLEKEAFARTLHDEVHRRMLQGHYDSLILVASPQMMGMLRKRMNGHIPIDRTLCMEATRLNMEQLEDRIFV